MTVIVRGCWRCNATNIDLVHDPLLPERVAAICATCAEERSAIAHLYLLMGANLKPYPEADWYD